jgi:hypothetical protein
MTSYEKGKRISKDVERIKEKKVNYNLRRGFLFNEKLKQ